MTEVERINKWLSTQGQTLGGKPLFRLVWSDSETEFRYGTFSDYYGSIFIRSETCTRRVPKYNYIKERWILEAWAPPDRRLSKELPESVNGTYEPLFVFEDRNGNYLKPVLKAVQLIIAFHRKGGSRAAQRELEIMNEINLKEDKEVQEFVDMLGE